MGLSPRGAGNTRPHTPSWRNRQVYPRVRGEYDLQLVRPVIVEGLSPRARGIPPSFGSTVGGAKVYPRVRGEYGSAGGAGRGPMGLSPRARGIRTFQRIHRFFERSIPACAGNTPTKAGQRRKLEVYPRVRGEYLRTESAPYRTEGLSPRARGIQRAGPAGRRLTRSIPACAGNTVRAELRSRTARVYPRVRGEYLRCSGAKFTPQGSIPACAGNTFGPTETARESEVYPRVRGEYRVRSAPSVPAGGLSHKR